MKLGRWLSLVLLLIGLYFLWRIRQVLLLVLSAVILTVPLNRLVNRWRRLGMRRSLAVLLATLTLLTAVLFLGLVLVPPFVEQLQRLVSLVILEFVELQTRLSQWSSQWSSQWTDPAIPRLRQVQPWIGWLLDQVYPLFSDAVAILLQFLLILILTGMLLANPLAYRRGLIQLFPSFYRQRIDAVLAECELRLVGWMQNLLWQMAIVGSVSAVGLLLLQIPLALTNAALASLLEIIPYLGVGLSLVPPLVAGGLETGWKAAAVIGLYLLLQFFKSRFVRQLNRQAWHPQLLPALLLLVQLSLSFFCGFLGLLLAVPIVLIGEVWVREILVNDLLKPWWQARHSV